MSTVSDCPDESTCPGGRHEWTPEPTVIHSPRVCLRGMRAAHGGEVPPPIVQTEKVAYLLGPEGPRQLDAHEVWCNRSDDHAGKCALLAGPGDLYSPVAEFEPNTLALNIMAAKVARIRDEIADWREDDSENGATWELAADLIERILDGDEF